MLHGAAAADAEMRAYWFDALGTCMLDPNQLPAVRVMAWRCHNLDRLAAKRVGNKKVMPVGKRDAVAEMTDMIDDEALNHGARR